MLRILKKPFCNFATTFTLLTLSSAIYAQPQLFPPMHNSQTNQTQSSQWEHYFNQLIDHNNPALGTFTQRYFVFEDKGTAKDAPVLYYLCGPHRCENYMIGAEVWELADKFHAKVVAIEHRYYGKSLPRQNLSTENLKYLTVENALEDIAELQKYLAASQNWQGKWIVIGGSYAGNLAAFSRLKHPELFVGALASSAPVKATVDYKEYDTYLTQHLGKECADNIYAGIKQMEEALTDQKKMNAIKQKFKATDIQDNLEFLSLVPAILDLQLQIIGSKEVCSMIKQSNEFQSPLATLAMLSEMVIEAGPNISAKNFVPQGAISENPADYNDYLQTRQWYYQSCTQLGDWQTAGTQQGVRSQLLNESYYQNTCKKLFGITKLPDVEAMNAKYYQPLLNPTTSHIFFTNGSEDPWVTLSLTTENNNTTNPNLNYFLLKEQGQMADLNNKPGAEEAKEQFIKLMAEWLVN